MKQIFLLFIILCLIALPSYALTLKESIDYALKNNPTVTAAQKNVEAAEARLRQALGAFLPTIKVEGSLGRSYTRPSDVEITIAGSTAAYTFGTDAAVDSKSLTTSVTQPLFVAGLAPGYSIALKSTDIVKEEFKKIVLETSFNVTKAYFGVLKAERFVKLSEQSLEMAQAHLRRVNTLISVGSATRADRLRAEVQLANSEVALTKAKNTLELARNSFNNSLGKNLDEEIKLTEETFVPEIPDLPDYKNLLKTALKNRPDWNQYFLKRKIAEENLSVAETALLPTVILTGKTGNSITEYPTYKTDVNSWSVTGIASWTLFDGLGIQNRIREAAANLDAQKAIRKQIRNNIVLEVRDAYLNLNSTLDTIASTQKALESAEENFKISDLRYSSGIGTNLEQLDAQISLTQARIGYFQSIFDLIIAKARINKVVGKKIF